MGLKQVFSNEGDFASQEAFDCVWEKGATGILSGRGKGYCQTVYNARDRAQPRITWPQTLVAATLKTLVYWYLFFKQTSLFNSHSFVFIGQVPSVFTSSSWFFGGFFF